MSGVHGQRLVGRIRPPTTKELQRYESRIGLAVTEHEHDQYLTGITRMLSALDRLDELDEPRVPLRHPYRDPGRVPSSAEDPLNAIIRFCEVRGADSGPLAGTRLGVKDCIAVAGVPTTVGGRRLPAAVPTEDAVVIERLLDAGATIAAKTNMADMGLGLGGGSAFGPTRNPHDPRFSSGGSSCGSGAAVAAGIVDAAVGADQAGSIRVPSAWCGIVGMKATHGLVPSHGLAYLDHTLDHVGPMTTTVADNAAMLEVMAGHDWRDPQWVRAAPVAGCYRDVASSGLGGMRIGVIGESLEPSGCTVATLDVFERARKRLAHLGADVVPVSVPLWTETPAIGIAVLAFGMAAMVASFGQGYGHLGRIDVNLLAATAVQNRSGSRALPWRLRTALLAVEHLREAYNGVHFGRAQNLRLELRRQVDALFTHVDLLITPTVPRGPVDLVAGELTDAEMVEHEDTTALSVNTLPFNLTGHPALTVPSGLGDDDLPTGLQIIGRRFEERTVYQAGFAFEAAASS